MKTGFTRHLMWINEKEGYMGFQIKLDGIHQYYSYLKYENEGSL
jgi:hypothetical protein